MTIYAYTRVSKAENEIGTTDNQIINIESQLKVDRVYSDSKTTRSTKVGICTKIRRYSSNC